MKNIFRIILSFLFIISLSGCTNDYPYDNYKNTLNLSNNTNSNEQLINYSANSSEENNNILELEEETTTPTIKTCCKYCSKGKACGDSCISRSYTCHKAPGCACDM